MQYYVVMMSSDGTNYAPLTPVSLNNTKQVSGLINGNTYYFKVNATALSTTSNYSAVVTCVPSTSSSAVRNVTTIPANDEFEVSFSPPLDDAWRFTIYI